MRAIREGVPAALRRAFARGSDHPADYNVSNVAKHLQKRIGMQPAESQWAVRALAFGLGYVSAPSQQPAVVDAIDAVIIEPDDDGVHLPMLDLSSIDAEIDEAAQEHAEAKPTTSVAEASLD